MSLEVLKLTPAHGVSDTRQGCVEVALSAHCERLRGCANRSDPSH